MPGLALPRLRPILCAMPANRLTQSLTIIEGLVYLFVFAVVVFGVAMAFKNYPAFLELIREDGPVEWLTVAGLILAMLVCFRRLVVLFHEKPWPFLVITALGGLVFLFGAGEEISWGQRIFGFESPDWFATQNVQGETNLHNLTIGGIELTQWLFGRGLGIALALYFAVLTPLHMFRPGVAAKIDYLGIPIPRARQLVVFAVIAAILLNPDIPGRESELFEMAAVLLFLVILANPRNLEAFRRKVRVDGPAGESP